MGEEEELGLFAIFTLVPLLPPVESARTDGTRKEKTPAENSANRNRAMILVRQDMCSTRGREIAAQVLIAKIADDRPVSAVTVEPALAANCFLDIQIMLKNARLPYKMVLHTFVSRSLSALRSIILAL